MTAVVKAIRKAYPEAQLTWIISQPAYDVVAGIEGVIFDVIKKPRSLADYWRLRRHFATSNFDVLLAAQASLRTNLIYPLINAKEKIGFDDERARDGHKWFVNRQIEPRQEHLLDGFFQLATCLPNVVATPQWGLVIPPSASQAMAKRIGVDASTVVVLNLFASKSERDWPLNNYAAVIAVLLKKTDIAVVLAGGGGERERQLTDQLLADVGPGCIDLVGKTSINELVALIDLADVLVSPDSGPVHIAVACNTDVIGLYAVASSRLSGPYQQTDYTVDKYPQAVRELLGKDSDKASLKVRVHDIKAMSLISVADVLEKWQQWLGARATTSNTP